MRKKKKPAKGAKSASKLNQQTETSGDAGNTEPQPMESPSNSASPEQAWEGAASLAWQQSVMGSTQALEAQELAASTPVHQPNSEVVQWTFSTENEEGQVVCVPTTDAPLLTRRASQNRGLDEQPQIFNPEFPVLPDWLNLGDLRKLMYWRSFHFSCVFMLLLFGGLLAVIIVLSIPETEDEDDCESVDF